jgi:integrase
VFLYRLKLTARGSGLVGETNLRLEALFVLAFTLGLRPGELRKLTWDHVDLGRGVVHVWRSASKSGDTKTPKSKRSLSLPKRAVIALKAHKARQDRAPRSRRSLTRQQPRVPPRGPPPLRTRVILHSA